MTDHPIPADDLVAGFQIENWPVRGRIVRLGEVVDDILRRHAYPEPVANLLGEAGANIVEVYHQRIFSDLPAKGALLEVVIETRDREHLNETVACLRAAGLEVEVQSNPGGAR